MKLLTRGIPLIALLLVAAFLWGICIFLIQFFFGTWEFGSPKDNSLSGTIKTVFSIAYFFVATFLIARVDEHLKR